MNQSNRFSSPLLLFAFALLWSATAMAEPHAKDSSSEFVLFLSTDFERMFEKNGLTSHGSDFTPALDVLYSKLIGNWRFFGEYLLTDHESELERIQIGYDASDESTFWFGRLHTPTSAWVSKYHHGRFLQSSISRPAIEEWEDDGGVVPVHIGGIMLDHGIPLEGSSGTRVSMAFGAGPYIRDGELLPFDLLDPDRGQHRLSAAISIAYFPDYVSESNFGLSSTHSQIVVEENPAQGIGQSFNINQTTLGAHVDWTVESWQLLAAAYYVHNSSEDVAGRFGGWFLSAYAELQRALHEVNTVYGRIELSHKVKTVDYLNLFPDFSTQRVMIGVRYEFRDNQAFSVEISDESSIGDSFQLVRVQWSAVFP